MEFRHYREADYDAVCGFLAALSRESPFHANWNWGRFEWMMAHPEFDREAMSSIGLWTDGDRVVGAAIYDMYFGEAFCGVLPDYAERYPEILSYAWSRLRDREGLGVALEDRNEPEIAEAKRQGFVLSGQEETVLRRELDRDLPSRLPEGYSLSELDPAKEPEAFQWLLWRGFDHGEDRAVFLREDPIVPRVRRHLRTELSLAAEDASGEKAAYCCLWVLAGTDTAYVEPVCTAPSHRGRGLARALLSEAMNRARRLGAERAYVISDLPFYRKLGFVRDSHFSFYRREDAKS